MFKVLRPVFFSVFLFACSDQGAVNSAADNQLNAKVQFQPEVHYRLLDNPLPPSDKNLITVTEFFWYGCSHCKKFEPYLTRWKKQLPENVIFEAMPAAWSQAMELHGMAFFIARSHENFEEIHARLFTEVTEIKQQKDLQQQKAALARLFATYNMPEASFYLQLESEAVTDQLKQAIDLMNQVKISGTPTVVVNGRYVVLNSSIESYEDLLAITDFLIQKELTPGL